MSFNHLRLHCNHFMSVYATVGMCTHYEFNAFLTLGLKLACTGLGIIGLAYFAHIKLHYCTDTCVSYTLYTPLHKLSQLYLKSSKTVRSQYSQLTQYNPSQYSFTEGKRPTFTAEYGHCIYAVHSPFESVWEPIKMDSC